MHNGPAIRDYGTASAKFVLIGEAPGRHELIHKLPFVGPSGGRLEVWWRRINHQLGRQALSRDQFFITNVLPYKPDNIERVSPDEMMQRMAEVRRKIDEELEGPAILIPTGNYALYAVTGKGNVSWHKMDGKVRRPGIMDWRGSILGYQASDGRVIKTIPTIHPAHILRNPKLERVALADWRRIAEDAEFPELRLPDCYHHIEPSIEDVEEFAECAIEAGLPVGLDIETPKRMVKQVAVCTGTRVVKGKGLTKAGKPRKDRVVEVVEWREESEDIDESALVVHKSGAKKGRVKTKKVRSASYLGCIGLANNTEYSITVPLTKRYWKTWENTARARGAVQRILDSDVDLVVQNGVPFDLPYLLHAGYTINLDGGRRVWDTREMHHCIDARDDHDLAYMASILTRFPYWKSEAKDPDEVTKYASNSQALWTYCGIDVLSMMTIFEALRGQLEAQNMMGFFDRHYLQQAPIKVDMTMHGIQVDDGKRREELSKLEAEAVELAATLEEAAGMPLIIKKGISNDRLKFLVYGERGFEGTRAGATFAKLRDSYPSVEPFNLPPMRKRATGGRRPVTLDEVALRKLILKSPKLKTLGPKILDYRRNRKKAEFLDAKALDPDYRLRCSYSSCTEAGRCASSKNPWGTGRNLQNVDREMRHVFVPDEE